MADEVAIVDYGVGNLRSVQKAFAKVGCEAVVTADPGRVAAARRIVVPGDGAFGEAMRSLREISDSRLAMLDALRGAIAEDRPFLGICLGMQLLLDESEEFGRFRGLGVIPGRCRRFPGGELKVPQIGWNLLRVIRENPLFRGFPEGGRVYFIHSFYCDVAEPDVIAATTPYGLDYCSALRRGNLFGVQFHPEKSGALGLAMLQAFASLPA